MAKEIKNIFSDTGCPSEDVMLKYTSDLLSGEEKHVFERHLAGCVFCSEALEGLSLMENKDISEDVFFLNKKIDDISKPGKRPAFWPLAAAASVSIMLLTGTWFYLHNNSTSPFAQGSEGKKQENPKEMTLAKVPEPGHTNDSLINKNHISDGRFKAEPEVFSMNQSRLTISSDEKKSLKREDVIESTNQLSYAQKEDLDESEKADKISAGYSTANLESMSPAPAASAAVYAVKAKMDSVSPTKPTEYNYNEMLAMVEEELQSPSVNNKMSEKKKSVARAVAKPEALKDHSLDDCPNCPKKVISEDAESDLDKISMEYALKKYHAGDFEQAHKQFDQIALENKNSKLRSEAGIYDALSLINLKKSDEALKVTEKIIGLNSGNTAAAKWLKASILLNRKENAKAKLVLEDLSVHDNPFQVKAKEILLHLK